MTSRKRPERVGIASIYGNQDSVGSISLAGHILRQVVYPASIPLLPACADQGEAAGRSTPSTAVSLIFQRGCGFQHSDSVRAGFGEPTHDALDRNSRKAALVRFMTPSRRNASEIVYRCGVNFHCPLRLAFTRFPDCFYSRSATPKIALSPTRRTRALRPACRRKVRHRCCHRARRHRRTVPRTPRPRFADRRSRSTSPWPTP